ncbi:hypothetical protein RB195_006783 [Necator americanus]|uniref:Uncharacterized protein n=1 Tax=Necator americanus TaxID=51031 RepID=A0ABR1BVL1_NECAM
MFCAILCNDLVKYAINKRQRKSTTTEEWICVLLPFMQYSLQTNVEYNAGNQENGSNFIFMTSTKISIAFDTSLKFKTEK